MVQWRGRRTSSNVEDTRGQRARGGMRAGGLKLKGGITTLVLIAVVYFMGGDVSQILGILMGGDTGASVSHPNQPVNPQPVGSDDAAQFVSVILADTEDTWTALFNQ